MPLTQVARGVLLRHLGKALSGERLFPGERESREAGVSTMSRRLRDAYEKAKLPRGGG